MVGTWSKSQTGKGPAYGVTQRRRGAAWLQAVKMLCVSAKISELGFSGARHRSGKVLKNGNAGPPRPWSPQSKRIRLA